MSTLYITEYSGLGFTGLFNNQHLQAPSVGGITAYNQIALGASSVLSNQLNAKTRLVKVCSDTDCHLNYGKDNTVLATNTNDFLPAHVPVFLAIDPSTYIAAITP